DDFVLPFYDAEASWNQHQHILDIDNCRWNFRRHSDRNAVAEYPSGERNAAEVNMVRRFADCVLSGKVDPFYPDLTLKTQRIIDACRRSDAEGGALIEL
ncbi:MAG: gfo/Idh/MocA family oxidoreductase, partial [Rubripirellula sp.]